MEDEQIINEKVEKIKEDVREMLDVNEVEKLLQKNEFEFNQNDITYKIVKPTFDNKTIVNNKRIEKYTELLKDEKMLLESDLILLYKKRGIDVDELSKQYDVLEKKRNELLLKLGKGLSEKKPEEELTAYRDEIKSIIAEQQDISMRKTVLLDSSIESQVNIYIYTYLSYLITQKKVVEVESETKETVKWVPAWNSYEEFIQEPESLVNQVVWYATLVARQELPFLKDESR